MVMVSDQEISRCVESLLRQSAPGSVTSVHGVVQQLESKLGLDLSHKAAFIRDQIHLLLCPPQPPPHPDQPQPQPQQLRGPQQKHHFALQPHPQFQNLLQYNSSPPPSLAAVHHYQQQQIPVSAGYGYLQQQHHELPFRFSAPPPTAAAVAAVHQQFHRQQQQQLQQQQQQQQFSVVTSSAGAAQQAAAGPSPKEGGSTGVKRRGGPGGLSKVCGVSPELQAIVGEPTMARTEIVKQLWAYIRKNNLQDPNNKRKIICNDELRLVFETDCTDMFKMNKLLAKHIIPLEPAKGSGPDSKRSKTSAVSEVVCVPKAEVKECPLVISDALAEFFGTGEREVLETEARRRVWDYIKANSLEDPVNSMVVSCDLKLQQLFGCEKLSALGIQELLARHLFKQS